MDGASEQRPLKVGFHECCSVVLWYKTKPVFMVGATARVRLYGENVLPLFNHLPIIQPNHPIRRFVVLMIMAGDNHQFAPRL